MDELTPLIQKKMQTLQQNTESPQATRARAVFVLQLLARFEAAAGKSIDGVTAVWDDDGKPISRKEFLINELQIAGVGQRHMEAAETWILRGNPVRYGALTLADFFPTPAQLAEVGFDLTKEIAKAERQAEGRGYDKGFHAAEAKAREEQTQSKPVEILKESERLELVYLRGLCEALTVEMDKYKADDIRATRLQGIKRKFADQFKQEN